MKNLHMSSSGNWKNPEIDMTDKFTREKQLEDLKDVAKKLQVNRGKDPNTQDENSFRNVFQDISTMLT